ncbi:MAG TPA: acetate/propionate family kinase [Pirellulales bacterium]|jgi:acetate kinase|nr:acetate/propionate family kinase [Pirellulales bacterium]
MTGQRADRVLVINSGSSSLKFALFEMGGGETLLLTGKLERIGLDQGTFQARDGDGQALVDRADEKLPDHETTIRRLLDWLSQQGQSENLAAAVHRVVHGGPRHSRPQRIDSELLAELKEIVPLASNHLPGALAAIEALRQAHPSLVEIACFDTAFHRQMPELAQRYPLPRQYADAGVLRYGFHGLSYEYVLQELQCTPGAKAGGRLVIAHLGNGASMAAVREGRSIDTTMGFTPTGGLMMGTRAGDLDPGLPLYLLEQRGMTAKQLHELLNRESGLIGVSGTSSDMQDLLRQEADHADAALAVSLFCYQAAKFVGALAAALGGLDELIFTGGIGENAAPIRARICERLQFLGIELDAARNSANAAVISRDARPVAVRVVKTNEELMMARHAERFLHEQAS